MRRKILVTGGTVFVSRYAAEYFAAKGDQVYVLNRNTKPQSEGVTLIVGDRHDLTDELKGYRFDVILDITAYTRADVENLVNALDYVGQYIFISSSAVYPETLPQPFCEEQPCGPNSIWGSYGTNKLEAERFLLERVPQAYILRPPYLYGPMENVYREPFVFECAEKGRPFYIPKDGTLPLQFFHVDDLCRFMEILLEKQPENRIFNVGNRETVSAEQWAALCYEVVGKNLKKIYVDDSYEQRRYFSFHDYAYRLDVSKQLELMPDTKPLAEGLRESYHWYKEHRRLVNRKPYLEFIDENIEADKRALKDRLRKEMLQKRRELQPEYCRESDQAIVNSLLDTTVYKEAKVIFCYVSTEREVDTRQLIETALGQGKIVAVPKCTGKGIMSARVIESLCDLETGAYGIMEPKAYCRTMEPQTIDLAVIPCVACDEKGTRLGYGGGYYDRYLPDSPAYRVLLCREMLMCSEVPQEPHDCFVNLIITERRNIFYKNRE